MSAEPGRAKIAPDIDFSDPHLVKECIRGNEAAWSTLIEKYKNLIFSIPIRYGFSEDESADIFQAVCMDLLTDLPSLREPKALAGWVIRITRNKCFHRKQAKQRQSAEPVDEINDPTSPEEPAELVEQLEQEQMLHEAISDLSPRCQKLVYMLFFEMPARPYAQVAKELELASGSIGFMRRRCLNKLRDRLEQMGV